LKKKKEVQEEKKQEVVPGAALEKFTRAVQEGMLQMDKKLKDQAEKIEQRDRQINDMAMFIKSQQQQQIESGTATVEQGPVSEDRDKPMTKNDLYMMVKDVIGMVRAQNQQVDPRLEMALNLQDRVLQVFYEDLAKKVTGRVSSDPGVS
tara:strand:- start:87 stop:533 length:447 start_codon:yes stop_codon:yes gene_type:complete